MLSKFTLHVSPKQVSVVLCALLLGLANAAAPPDALNELPWRSIGPYRGGWSTVAVGLVEQPQTYFFGAAGGGVWKTTDAGSSWHSLTDAVPVTSIGAFDVAQSDPNVMYLGSGQPQARYDTGHGYGVFVSRNGGQTWAASGLEKTRHIGDLWVDPRNPQRVLVAALGPYYDSSPERGVFLSENGGKSWAHTLKIDDSTGAVDLAVDPSDSRIVFAASWTARNYPWMSYFTPMQGQGSGLYKSTNGGKSFSRIQGKGWPTLDANGAPLSLGRVGVAVTNVQGKTRVYALIDHKLVGGLYRSDDAGVNWTHINPDPGLTSRYFARLSVAPNDADTVYVMHRSMKVSSDGGKSFKVFRGSPGGDDYHGLWINPKTPNNMVAASDQGTIVSLNGGESWGNWYNQPTGQFYCLHADAQFPYHLYSGQQDNGSVAITSRSDFGAINFRDWHPVGADERDCDVPDPTDANIVYGSGLGGRVGRFDARTGDVQNITPVPLNTYGADPRSIDQRWSWITPLTISERPPYALYLGSQQLYRSLDRGDTWASISPDLTGRTQASADCQGDITDPTRARACGFGVIFTIAPSTFSSDEVWIGTDSGLVQRTQDGGKSWQDVTPKSLPVFATVSRIELSKLDRNTAYVAIDSHRLPGQNNFVPRLYATHDAGKSWAEINAGLPTDQLTSVIRADHLQPGLLFAGTERSAFVSLNDGAQWQPLAEKLPSLWIRDMRIVGDDLAIASQGRGLWILDNISRLRELSRTAMPNKGSFSAARLFAPARATRMRRNSNKDTPLAAEVPQGQNPPHGAMLEYYLPKAARTVRLRITDAKGLVVQTFSNTDAPETLVAEQYFSDLYLPPEGTLSAAPGAHRWLWNLRHARTKAPGYEYTIAATPGLRTAALPEGGFVLPGVYQIELDVDGVKSTQSLTVRLDPRVTLSTTELHDIALFNAEMAAVLATISQQIATDTATFEALSALEKTAAAGVALQARLEGTPGNTGLNALAAALAGTASDVESAERVPTAAQRAQLRSAQAWLARLNHARDRK
jgi:photosystem II stability/assembly factor-like uncharacterized protein